MVACGATDFGAVKPQIKLNMKYQVRDQTGHEMARDIDITSAMNMLPAGARMVENSKKTRELLALPDGAHMATYNSRGVIYVIAEEPNHTEKLAGF